MLSSVASTPAHSLRSALLECSHYETATGSGLCAMASTSRTVATLVALGADPIHANSDGFTALMTQVYKGNDDAAIRLMYCYDRADFMMTNRYGSTAFGRAAYYGRLRWFEATISHLEGLAEEDAAWDGFLQKMLNHQNGQGFSVLMEVVRGDSIAAVTDSLRFVPLANLLMAHGADMTLADKEGKTVVFHATKKARWAAMLSGPWASVTMTTNMPAE